VKSVKVWVGSVALAVLAVLSLGWPLWVKAGGGCALGQDVQFPLRTVCERTVGGLGSSLAVGLLSGGGAVLLALTLALLARRWRGPAEMAISRGADVLYALPDVLVLIGIGFAARLLEHAGKVHLPPFWLMVASLTFIGWAGAFRMFHNRFASLERMEFVSAAVAVGAGRGRILVRHVLPMSREFVLSVFLARVPGAILAESTVSFLGFGLPPDHPSLGSYFGQNYKGEWRIVAPVWILLVLTVIAFTWTAEALKREG
jgi:oligopeptide transport system permease protein